MIPLRQVVRRFDTTFVDPILVRRDRQRLITVHADVLSGPPSRMFARVRPRIEALTPPPGMHLEWGGEYEDSQKATAGLAASLPLFIGMMILIVITLFNALKQPLIIWLTVPLAIIGVTGGLLATQNPFDFMAMLGFLSLIGMLIKNAIVLIDEIDLQVREGLGRYEAILTASTSRLRPVGMAASTTALGMLPLLPDVFFAAMSVTIIAGLVFATVLTMVFVPVLYALFFNVHEGDEGGEA